MKKYLFILALLVCLGNTSANAQCFQFINYPSDTVGWIYGSDHGGQAFYLADTFVITTSHGGENNYLYNSFPVTMMGAASAFTASFDFRLDSESSCSDGLTFWFLTSGLSGLGSPSHEGGDLGYPDTSIGFSLAMQTTVCMNNIYLKKMSSDSYLFSSSTTAGDTVLGTPLNSQMFLSDGNWHHCVVDYENGYITASYDGGIAVITAYSPIYGAGHFGFMATNGGGYTRKCLKNIQICAGFGNPTAFSDSFSTYVNRLCNGPQIEVLSDSFSTSYHVRLSYGDGTSDSLGLNAATSGGGYAVASHAYGESGAYTISEMLYDGAAAIDSISFSYENIFCATLPVKLYFDTDGDCVKEGYDPFLTQPVTVEVDSNGIPIDTLSATSGFYYSSNGNIGDVYAFKLISAPGNMTVSCPSSGIVYDTLTAGVFINPIRYFAMNCTSGTAFDLQVNATIPVTGIHDQWADIYLNNTYCEPVEGTLTLHYSPKYAGTPSQVDPTPLSMTGNSIVWDAGILSSTNSSPVHLHYQVNYGTTTLTIGDTVQSYFTVTPIVGDTDSVNNGCVIIDTVRAGCDPNEMWVSPSGCIAPDTAGNVLQYTINFTNVGNDTAYNIYVLDTLPANVVPNSLRIVTASNMMNVSSSFNGTNTVVKFDFPSINLQDSAACPQCNGGLVFTVRTVAGLPDGTALYNRASVYFDDNAPVVTNTVADILGGCTTGAATRKSADGKVSVFPNPATQLLHVVQTQSGFSRYAITNAVGQELGHGLLVPGSIGVLDISGLPSGLYYLICNGADGSYVTKFLKM